MNRPLREWSATDKEQDKENKLPSTDEPPRKFQCCCFLLVYYYILYKKLHSICQDSL